jgi:RNA polymerase sigma-70 factor (ECF subfamily)
MYVDARQRVHGPLAVRNGRGAGLVAARTRRAKERSSVVDSDVNDDFQKCRFSTSSKDRMTVVAPSARDRGAAVALLRRHMPRVRRFLNARMRDGAEDIEQETALACLENIDRLSRASNTEAFLIAVARNHLRLHLRQRARMSRRHIVAATLVLVHPHDGGADDAADSLELVLEALPAPMRAVVQMVYWSGLSQPQVAAILGVPVGTVATRLRLAKTRLRMLLESRLGSR